MSNNGNYIKLPSIKSIAVNNYALFNSSWSYSFKNGLNLFLGANGFGKTTTANLIIYGIVGVWRELAINTRGKEDVVDKLDENYFLEREHFEQRKKLGDKKPSITVEFDIESTKISVQRCLSPLEIMEVYINGERLRAPKSLSLEEAYSNKLLKLCGIDNINDLSFLIRKLIVREEEGNSLLWNTDDQSKVIRLLFNPLGFFRKYYDIQKDASKAESVAKRARDQKSPFVSKLLVLKAEKEKEIRRIVGNSDQPELSNKYETLSNELSGLVPKQNKLFQDIQYINEEARRLEEQYNNLSAELDDILESTAQMEYDYFGAVYHEPRISLVYNKIDQRKSCIFCQNNVNDEVKLRITTAVKENHCPVCNNSLIHEPIPKTTISEVDIRKLEKLRQDANQKQAEKKSIKDAKIKIESEHVAKWKEQSALTTQINAKKNELNELKLVLEQYRNEQKPTNQFDKAIESYELAIAEYDETIKEHDKIFREKKGELTEINSQLNKRIEQLTTDLSRNFQEYLKHFHYKDFDLLPMAGRKPRVESKVPLTTFCPTFEGKERKTEKSVSKSEGILLEYIFRMSIIKLYYTLTKVRPFLILESSEGSFDIVRTQQLASVFSQFGRDKFPFIMITNLSKPDFVLKILKNLHAQKVAPIDYKKRVLNFIEYGIHDELLDEHKKSEKIEYAKGLKTLGL